MPKPKPELVRVEGLKLFIGSVFVRDWPGDERRDDYREACALADAIRAELQKEFVVRARHVAAAKQRRGPVHW